MKRIKTITILTMVIIALLIGANGNVQATQPNNNIKSIETTATGMLINYNDNTGYYIDFKEIDNNVVEFINSKQIKLNLNKYNYGSTGWHKYRNNK